MKRQVVIHDGEHRQHRDKRQKRRYHKLARRAAKKMIRQSY